MSIARYHAPVSPAPVNGGITARTLLGNGDGCICVIHYAPFVPYSGAVTEYGLPVGFYRLDWQDQLAWLEHYADADNDAHGMAWSACMEMKYNVQ